MLTKRQKQILDFVNVKIEKDGYSPTFQEIARHFRLSSISTIHEHLEELKKKGYIEKLSRQARAIKLRNQNETLIKVPLLGTIAAGRPIEMFSNKETIAIPQNRIPKTGNIFTLQVAGNSMVDERINDGDVILVKQQSTAENGQKVVALIDNYETTLKKYYKEKNRIRLQPANENIEPIIVRRSQDFSIQGIVIDIIKNERELATEQMIIPERTEKYKSLPLNKVIAGDVIEELKKIPNESINLTFADPPFNLNKKYGNYKDKRANEEYVSWCEKWLTELVRITKPDGSILIHNIPKWLIYYANHLNKLAFFKHWIAWDSMSTPLGKTLLPAHYGILFYTKNRTGFKFNELRAPHKKCPHCNQMIKDYGGKKSQINPYGTLLSDVWGDIHRIRHKNRRDEHPCQLPEPLMERLILMTTDEKDVILDPFIGAGTTALAAKRLGRNFIGIDIDPKYKSIVEKKLKQINYRLTNGYTYSGNTGKNTSKYLRNLTLSEKEGVYPLDNPLFGKKTS